MSLSDYQITFGQIGSSSPFMLGAGTSYLITNIDGLGGTSPLRIQDDNRGYIDGSYTGRDFYDERTVYIDVTVLSDSTNSAQYNYEQLQAAFAPQQLAYYPDPTGLTISTQELQEFIFKLSPDSTEKIMYGRSRGLVTAIDPEYTYGYIRTRIQLTFPDPRYYDYVGTTAGPDASIDLFNYGWAESCPVLTIASANTSGYISNLTGTTVMYFDNITAGSTLVIDLLQRNIYVDGYPARNVMLANSTGWLSILPVSLDTWTSTVGDMETTFRNAYV